jgi:hypothetical protein
MTSTTKLRVALSVPLLTGWSVLASAFTGCGSYDEAIPATTAGTAGQTASSGSGGQSMAGSSGSSGEGGSAQAGSGGSNAAAGAAGSGSVEVTPIEASCNNVTPCGGDLVGTWIAAGSCLPVTGDADMSGFGLGCSAAPVTGALEVSGTWTVNGDGTFTDETTTSGDSEILLPPTCLDVSGTVTTCDRVGGPLQALGFASVTCVPNEDSGGCTCSATAGQSGGLATLSLDAARSGTYAMADDTVTTSARTDVAYAYCVSDDVLTITPQTTSKTGSVNGTIAFVRR